MCKFETISKESLKKSPSYIISTVILNKNNDFTIEEIFNEVKDNIIQANSKIQEVQVRNYALEKIRMFIENGIVIEHGSYFSLKRRII